MAHAEICPVCKGDSRKADKQCYGCGGKGVVEAKYKYRNFAGAAYSSSPMPKIQEVSG